MPIFIQLRRWIYTQINQMSEKNIILAFGGYLLISWLGLNAIGETAITQSFTDFVYYLVVTSSTVGYGDFSPATDAGKWFVALFIIPVGLGIFALTLGRIATLFILYWKRSLLGKRKIKVNDHILVLGWNEQRTLHLLNMLQHEQDTPRPIVLCVRPEIENPRPGEIEFVRVTSFTDQAGMNRAGVQNASCIIIDNPEDDITLSAALFCSGQNPNAHILAYFNDEGLSILLKHHCPNVECIPSVSVEMLAKAAVDPGSSTLHHELLSSEKGMTQYSVIYPTGQGQTSLEALFLQFKQQYEAILIAVDRGQGIELNPPLNTSITGGDKLFYIAEKRIHQFRWSV
ncbi:potassium channel protein [Vibrio sp. MEBiC08052]|uniref:potassium channel protein n=1 Tax=Vibrio sp. MEBiC08052 TaxID=1761910 RepID=UPI0007407422|nr:potassium channel family protein [Vibrio sp. MEBiC08052]KUI99068.1 putative potassium channel related protein [Vibrio sp. MEBiC08052]